MIAGVLLAGITAAAPCTLPAAGTPDPATARVFIEVGDAQLAAGHPKTAEVAYRQAVRLDPSNRHAHHGFVSACAQANARVTFKQGRERMNAGDLDGAIAIFERLRHRHPDPAASLLEAICYINQGKDAPAKPLLAEARRSPALASRAAYFQGLVALREGASADAAAAFERAATGGGGSLVERARTLRAVAFHSGRWLVSAFAESGYNTNVTYVPDGLTPVPGAAMGIGASGWARPRGRAGPYAGLNGFYELQLAAPSWNLGRLAATGGWRWGRGGSYVLADYDFNATLLGGAPFLYEHRIRAVGRLTRHHLSFSAAYVARIRRYQTTASGPYSGVLQTLDPTLSWWFGFGSSISLGYHTGRAITGTAATSEWEHGPRITARLVILPTLSARAEAGVTWRPFDGGRFDRVVYAGAEVEKDLYDHFTVSLSGADRVVHSTDTAVSYSRFTLVVDLRYTLGLQ